MLPHRRVAAHVLCSALRSLLAHAQLGTPLVKEPMRTLALFDGRTGTPDPRCPLVAAMDILKVKKICCIGAGYVGGPTMAVRLLRLHLRARAWAAARLRALQR